MGTYITDGVKFSLNRNVAIDTPDGPFGEILQNFEDALETQIGTDLDVDAADCDVADAGGYFAGANVEAVLQEIGAPATGAGVVGFLTTTSLTVGADVQAVIDEFTTSGTDGALLIGAAADGVLTGATTLRSQITQVATHIASAQQAITIPLTSVREVFTGATGSVTDTPATNQATGGFGSLLCANTTPTLTAINGVTDNAFRLTWTTSNQDPVAFQTAIPPNIDVAADMVLHVRAAMEGVTDTPTIALATYFNEGDTAVADATGAVTGTSYAEYTATIAASDVPAGSQTMTVRLTPGAHATGSHALYVSAIWLEYTGILLTS